MAIGAHELLLIVRAQNQASALLGRVGRDFRRLQNMKALDIQRSRQANQIAGNLLSQQSKLAKIQSVMAKDGKANLENAKALDSVYRHQLNIQNRINSLDIRRAAIGRAGVNLEVQRLRLQQRELGIENSLEKIEARRVALNNQLGTIGTRMMRNNMQQASIAEGGVKRLGLEAQLMERQLTLRKAQASYMKAVSAGGPVKDTPVDIRRQIATKRVAQTTAAIAALSGEQAILEGQMKGLAGTVKENQLAFDNLAIAERNLAGQSAILTKQHESLAYQLAHVDARTAALGGTEAELNAALAATADELAIVNARWEQTTAAAEAAAIGIQHDTEALRIMNAQLAETDALMAAQSGEKMRTYAQATSHIGRILTATGLIGVAVFAALGVSAAHFNAETTRASTQTGNIFTSNAKTIAAGADKIGKSIINIMQTVPANAHDLANSFYYIYSTLNTTLGQGAKLVKLFSEAWLAGGMVGSVEDVSKALVTLGNNWGISAKSGEAFRRLVASTMATVRFGGLDLQQYTSTLNQLAPAFKGAHQSIEEMNGAIAFLTRLMPSQGQASTGIARLVQQMSRLAARPAPGFEKLAHDIQDANGNLKPFSEVLRIIMKEHPEIIKSGVALQNFWKDATGNQGTIMAYKAFQAFVSQHKLYQHILHQTSGDQKEFNRSLAAMRQSTGVKWDTFVSQMHALGLELGTVMAPALLKVVKPLQSLAHWFHNLSDEQKRTIGTWLGYAAAITLVVGVVATIVGGLAAFIMAMGAAAKALGILEGTTGKGAKTLKVLAYEAGFINARFAKMLGVVGLLIVAFPILQKVTGDTSNTFEILFDVFAGATLLRSMKGLGSLTRGAGLLRGSLLNVRGAMLGLRSASLLEITAILLLSAEVEKMIRKIPGWDKAWKGFGDALYGGTHKATVETQVTLNNLKQIRAEIEHPPEPAKRPSVLPTDAQGRPKLGIPNFSNLSVQTTPVPVHRALVLSQGVIAQDIDAITKLVTKWQNNPIFKKHVTIEEIKQRIKDMFPELDEHGIEAVFNSAMGRYNAGLARLRAAQQRSHMAQEGAPTGLTPSFQLTTAAFLDDVRKAYALKQKLDKAPDLASGRKAWLAYQHFHDKIFSQMTKVQQQMFESLLGMMGNFAQAFTPITPKILAVVRHVNDLQKAAALAPKNLDKWNAWFKAQLALSSKYSSDIISNAQAILTALEKAPVVKLTPELLKAAEAVNALQKAATAAPTDLSKWNAFLVAQTALTKKYSAEQISAINEVISAIENLAPAPTHTLQQLLTMARAIDKMEKRFAKHPTLALSAEIAAASKALTAASVGDQESIVQNVINAENALVKTIKTSDDKKLDLAKKLAKSRNKLMDDEYKKELARQKKAQDTIKSATDNIMQIYQSALQTYQGQLGTLFQGPFMQSPLMAARQQFGFSARPQDLVKDEQMGVAAFKKFQGTLTRLRKRGAPQEMIDQLQQLGPEAQKQLDTLMKDPKQLKKFVTAFQQGQTLAQAAAKADLVAQLKKWAKFGKQVALAIAAGLRSENVALENEMRAMLHRMFPNVFKVAATKPVKPKHVTAKDIEADRNAGKLTRHTSSVVNNVTYHVHPSHAGEGLETMLRRSHFHYRNKKGNL